MPGLLDFLGLGGGPTYTQDGQPVAPQGLLGGFGRGLQNNSDSLMGFGMGMLSGGRESGWANALQGMQRGEVLDRTSAKDKLEQAQLAAKKKAYADWAAKNPEAAKYAPLIAANPDLGDKIVTAQATRNPLDDQYRMAQIQELKRKADGRDATFGLTPLYGERKNPDGTTTVVPMQVSNQGGLRESPLPPGMTLAKGIEKIDAGTYWIIKDKLTGATIGTEPKNVQEREAAEKLGAAQGGAQAGLPDAIMAGEQMITNIGEVRDHPGKWIGTGGTSLLSAVPGSPGKDFQVRVDQLKGGAYMAAVEKMRGLGALSDNEGRAATAAITRLNSSTSEKEFDSALNELELIMKRGMEKARQKAAGNFTGQPPQGAQPPQGVPPTAPGQPPKRIKYDADGNPL